MHSQPPSLSDALDFSNIKTSTEINEKFSELAESLLLHYNLCIECINNDDNDNDARSSREIFEFQLLEIEFYLYSPNVHEDPFCHGHVNQTKAGQWYFHRAGKGKLGIEKSNITKESETPSTGAGYRGGTRKGVDLTFGNPVVTSPFFPVSSPIHGGILLRSMRSLDSKNVVISGPSLLVDRILQLTRSESVAQLVNHKLKGHLSAIDNSPGLPASSSSNEKTVKLYFRECTSRLHDRSPEAVIIERSPRVGLELSHSSVSPIAADPRVSFIGKMYRYFIYPNLLKSSNRYYKLIYHLSRQDFINHLEGQSEQLATDLMTQFEKETLIRNRIILEKYVSAFQDGYRKHDLGNFVGSAGRGISSNPLKYLKMMGAICRLGLLEES